MSSTTAVSNWCRANSLCDRIRLFGPGVRAHVHQHHRRRRAVCPVPQRLGSIGISLATAAITERTQVHRSYLSQWTTPLHQPFETLIATYEQALRTMGRAGSAVRDDAIGRMYQVFQVQAAVLAFADIFLYAAIVAFIMIPLSFLVAPIKCPPKPTPHHAGVRH